VRYRCALLLPGDEFQQQRHDLVRLEPAPTTAPYWTTKSNWDLTAAAYGGNPNGGLKRVYVRYRNVNCMSVTTHDEIEYQCPTATYYRDADGDGYGNPAVTTQACTPPAGYVRTILTAMTPTRTSSQGD